MYSFGKRIHHLQERLKKEEYIVKKTDPLFFKDGRDGKHLPPIMCPVLSILFMLFEKIRIHKD